MNFKSISGASVRSFDFSSKYTCMSTHKRLVGEMVETSKHQSSFTSNFNQLHENCSRLSDAQQLGGRVAFLHFALLSFFLPFFFSFFLLFFLPVLPCHRFLYPRSLAPPLQQDKTISTETEKRAIRTNGNMWNSVDTKP